MTKSLLPYYILYLIKTIESVVYILNFKWANNLYFWYWAKFYQSFTHFISLDKSSNSNPTAANCFTQIFMNRRKIIVIGISSICSNERLVIECNQTRLATVVHRVLLRVDIWFHFNSRYTSMIKVFWLYYFGIIFRLINLQSACEVT